MITYGKGDLLKADADALINTVNCVGIMGKGIALQFKRRYPENFKAYERACKHNEVRIGTMFVTETLELEGPRYIVNFPTKQHWRSPSQLSFIQAGLKDLIHVIQDLGLTSIAIPPLGAGNGGLDWRDVEPLLLESFSDLPDVRFILYAPTPGTRQIAPPKRIRMSWGRATLLHLMRSYIDQRRAAEPWEDTSGVSHLEIQKLMYFANEAEPKLSLSYAPGRYGPYSEKVRHLLTDIEGAYTSGFGDGSAKALNLEPVSLTNEGIRALDEYLRAGAEAPKVEQTVDTVLSTIRGFEGPYGVELLASTHWVVTHQGATDHAAAANAVRSWTKRKGRLYTDVRVGVALDRVLATAVGTYFAPGRDIPTNQ
ncbi:macro domain-containing protein [Mycolicibacter heraklionensis]|uniref:Macro domain-containing protein n=1 Tax=Mycolicibacter heraklionensis TaxID=512402 RepID=A0A9X7ZG81_9MYCO|nr:macro domain-containing protein [Mycolicibacter heraklionensis]QZA08824.1 macro domain-containing protein [Mycolicibacter heraklionensis]